MKIYNVLLSALLIAFLPVSGFAIETYNSVYIDGSAPITIDGDLSDWTGLSLATPQLCGIR